MSENSKVEHCQRCVLGVLFGSKWERLWMVTVWRPIALNFTLNFKFATCSEEREVLNRFGCCRLMCLKSLLFLGTDIEANQGYRILRPIRDTGWFAEWEVLFSLDRCGRALRRHSVVI